MIEMRHMDEFSGLVAEFYFLPWMVVQGYLPSNNSLFYICFGWFSVSLFYVICAYVTIRLTSDS